MNVYFPFVTQAYLKLYNGEFKQVFRGLTGHGTYSANKLLWKLSIEVKKGQKYNCLDGFSPQTAALYVETLSRPLYLTSKQDA